MIRRAFLKLNGFDRVRSTLTMIVVEGESQAHQSLEAGTYRRSDKTITGAAVPIELR
jgi:hypothetical protein